jgi:hypothetical protein
MAGNCPGSAFHTQAYERGITLRFHFRFEESNSSPEEQRLDLLDVDAAKCRALQFMSDILCDRPRKFWESETCRVTVSDRDGLILFSLDMVATLAPAFTGYARRSAA